MKKIKKIDIKNIVKQIKRIKTLRVSYSTEVALLAVVYFLAGRFGLNLDAVHNFAAPVWFPTGISLAALYLFGYRLWPGIFLGAFFINLLSGAPFFSAFGMGIGNTLEAVVGTYILHRFGFQSSLDRVRDVLVLTGIAGPISALVSATIGVTSMWLGNLIQLQEYGNTWLTWWIGDTLSDIIIAPFLLVWTFPFVFRSEPRYKILEGIAVAAVLFIFTVFIFSQPAGFPIAYAIFPPLIWASLRFGPRFIMTAIFFISIFAVLTTSQGIGPFLYPELSQSLIYLQLYLGVISVSSFIFSAVISERNRLEKRKDDFLSMASHELKTPVTTMKIYGDVLRKHVKNSNDPKLEKMINNVVGQTDRMKELVSDLLDVSRIEAGKLQFTMEDFDISELITDVKEGLQSSTEKHTISYSRKSRMIVHGDKYRMYQVLTNLLNNAIKYSPHGGEILIKATKKDNKILVSVKDNGIGIEEDQRERIFDRLYQAGEMEEKTYPGLGMGLYISKEIIRRHGGEIWVDSEKKKGSTFYFTIPQKN